MKNPLNPGFSLRNILFTICFRRVWIAIMIFLIKKQAFDGLLKIIGIQILF